MVKIRSIYSTFLHKNIYLLYRSQSFSTQQKGTGFGTIQCCAWALSDCVRSERSNLSDVVCVCLSVMEFESRWFTKHTQIMRLLGTVCLSVCVVGISKWDSQMLCAACWLFV